MLTIAQKSNEHSQAAAKAVAGIEGIESTNVVFTELLPEEPQEILKHARHNKQLYATSAAKGSEQEQFANAMPGAFHNAKDPNLLIQHEKSQHSMVIYLKAQGSTNREIAAKMEMTEAWVSQILRQPWARAKLQETLREAGKDAITAILKGAAADCLFTLIDVRDSALTPPAVKVAASNALLDRFLGKPQQKIEVESKSTKNAATQMSEIDRQLEELKREKDLITGVQVAKTN